MERIICDSYIKGEKQLFKVDADDLKGQEANRRILAANEMFGWLYKEGILRKVSFEIKDYPEAAHFAFDVKDLEPYRDAMERSGVWNADLAVRLIFDEAYTPCVYSGAIELGWSMGSYRSVDGSVGRSWECGLVQSLNTEGVYEVFEAREKDGVRTAVSKVFELLEFEPDLFQQAFEHYSAIDRSMEGYRDYLDYHGDKLIYCYQNNFSLDLLDVDCWVQFEALLGEHLSHDEYLVLNEFVGDVDPHDIEDDDRKWIGELRDVLDQYRSEHSKEIDKESLDERILSASRKVDLQQDKGTPENVKDISSDNRW